MRTSSRRAHPPNSFQESDTGPSRYPDWEATFIPGTTVLANKLGITNAAELAEVEYQLAGERQREIDTAAVHIERTYNQQHLLAIHHHLFQDLYDWAGQIRTYPLWKNPVVSFAEPHTIADYLDHAHEHIAATPWPSLDHQHFAHEAATVYAAINYAHPCREGNGRTAKLFMTQLATEYGWDLDFDRVTAREWNQAAALSAPDRGAFDPVPDELFPIFERLAILQPRIQTPNPHADDTARHLDRLAALEQQRLAALEHRRAAEQHEHTAAEQHRPPAHPEQHHGRRL